jgi:hypothetical protein
VLEYRKPFDELGAEIGKKASKDLEYFGPLCPFFNFNIYTSDKYSAILF